MVRHLIEQGGGHFLITKDRRPFAKGEIGSDNDRGSLIQMREQMEDQLATQAMAS